MLDLQGIFILIGQLGEGTGQCHSRQGISL